jgi:hypothetical protein
MEVDRLRVERLANGRLLQLLEPQGHAAEIGLEDALGQLQLEGRLGEEGGSGRVVKVES